jgi:magnesium transporter
MEKKYKAHTAGSIMVSDYFIARPEKTIQETIDLLFQNSGSCEFMDYGYILNENQNLIGVISIVDLFRQPKNKLIKDIMRTEHIHFVSPNSKDEAAAHAALRYKIKAVPVACKGRMLGVIPAKKILSIMHHSAQKDFLRMAGISESHLKYEGTMDVPVLTSVWHRLPWLMIGLFGIILGAGFMGFFEEQLKQYMILAFFVPAIVYLSAALGSQHVTVCVRDLASGQNDFNRLAYMARQSAIALFLGLLMSAATYLIVLIFWGEAYIGLVISIALFVSAMLTNITSLGTTLLIDKLGKDPALGSGPFSTVVSDVSSIIIYMLIASAML